MEVVETDTLPEDEEQPEETYEERRAREKAEERVLYVEYYIQGLREMITFLEERPDLIPDYNSINLDWYFDNDEMNDFIAKAKRLGKSEKYAGYNFELFRSFGPHKVRVLMSREAVCTKTITGTRTVAAIPERVIPAVPEHVEATYEWICPPSILGLGAEEPEVDEVTLQQQELGLSGDEPSAAEVADDFLEREDQASWGDNED